MLFPYQQRKVRLNRTLAMKHFYLDVIHVTSVYISLVKASHMAMSNMHGAENVPSATRSLRREEE